MPQDVFKEYVVPFVSSAENLSLLGAGALFAFLQLSRRGSNSSRKSKLGTSRFGDKVETTAARREAMKQRKAAKHNEVALRIGLPADGLLGKDYSHCLDLPNTERGVGVVGQPGSGKTFSAIDPMLRDAVRQGFPILLYDYKYPDESQCETVVTYAVKHGYKVHVFAPTFPESLVVNPLDFLRDEQDAETARQIAEVINANFDLKGSKEDGFFGPAGKLLTQAILMLAKGTGYPDILMGQQLLGLKNLSARLERAELNPWVRASFNQFISLSESEKTVASIVGTASLLFSRFVMPSVLNSFLGTTTLPLYLEGKQIVVLGMNRELRDVLAPLIAAVLDRLVIVNTSRRRKDPLILSLDEVPTLYLPNLVKWINELRSKGLVTVCGFQNFAQVEDVYGKEKARSIWGALATKLIFNPGEFKSAEEFANTLGEQQIEYKTKSRGSSGGKGSNNTSDQVQARKLFEPAQFLRLLRGHVIALSPGFRRGNEGYIPIRRAIKISNAELKEVKKCADAWPRMRKKLIEGNRQQQEVTGEDIKKRQAEAEALLPVPPEADPENLY
ncbi:type IV secretory system conjugative DNA transfer family protein [Gloeobacter morelensis]|uniref:type IV secretory system conjugative DNA transfer family protein n=1 Tax=Gloeobacter morelensis TaxID=2907343 RepID=UPI001E3FA6A1|nr:TraM recognition domain-containing protein [Gloeobacter morelensis]UFP97135.1 type IV secretory system conjugative DNA transfer family protein [Gloeobacter morelensis MG652769]